VRPIFSPGPNFHTYLERERGLPVVVAVGELDLASVAPFEAVLTEAETEDVTSVIVDLRQLTFIDSSGLHSLVRASKRAADGGRRIVLTRAPRSVQGAFDITLLAERFEWVDDPMFVDP
jgi:anti-anti-sigma factor